MKYFISLLLLSVLLLSGCLGPRHNILGSSGYGYNQQSEILSNIIVDGLHIRHVRLLNDKDCVSGYSEHLELVGPIGPDSTTVLERILPRLHKCYNEAGKRVVNSIFMSSGGGYLSDGFKLGRLLRKYSTSTRVTGGQSCASSCAIAFLGGDFRSLNGDATLLFHSPYINNYFNIDCSDTGQVGELKKYYIEMLGQENGTFLLDRTMRYCSASDGWTINADAAEIFGLLK